MTITYSVYACRDSETYHTVGQKLWGCIRIHHMCMCMYVCVCVWFLHTHHHIWMCYVCCVYVWCMHIHHMCMSVVYVCGIYLYIILIKGWEIISVYVSIQKYMPTQHRNDAKNISIDGYRPNYIPTQHMKDGKLSECMSTYIHTHIRTHVRTYIHTYIHKYIHTGL